MSKKKSNQDNQLEQRLEALRPVPERNPETAARSKALFLGQAGRMRPEASRRLENQRKKTVASAFPASQKRGRPLWNTLFAVFLASVFFFGGAGITAYAAQESMPDEMLYPLKTLSEDVRLSLASSPQKRIDLNLDFSDRRVTEITGLYASGKSVPQAVMDRLRAELNAILEDATRLDDQAMIRVLEQVRTRAEIQWKTINDLAAEYPRDLNLAYAAVRLRQQIELSAEGEVDPQGFRMQIGQQSQFTNGTTIVTPASGNGQSGAGTIPPQGTPTPGGSGNEPAQGQSQSGSQAASTPEGTPIPGGDAGQGGNQPTGNQGQQGPAATHTPSPSRTPHSSGGSGKGP